MMGPSASNCLYYARERCRLGPSSHVTAAIRARGADSRGTERSSSNAERRSLLPSTSDIRASGARSLIVWRLEVCVCLPFRVYESQFKRTVMARTKARPQRYPRTNIAAKRTKAVIEKAGAGRVSRRRRPGASVRKEIKRERNSTTMLIPKAPFVRVIREVAQKIVTDTCVLVPPVSWCRSAC